MIFIETELEGAFLVKPEALSDERGFFARCYCKDEFVDSGIEFECKQCNYSFNNKKGTLRGMHYQKEPYLEAKIVTCIRGSVYDVIIDLRKESSSYLKWQGFYLNEKDLCSLYIPKGFAHGFVTLEDSSCLHYQMSEFYRKGYEAGVRYDDPTIGIKWPFTENLIISKKDQGFAYI